MIVLHEQTGVLLVSNLSLQYVYMWRCFLAGEMDLVKVDATGWYVLCTSASSFLNFVVQLNMAKIIAYCSTLSVIAKLLCSYRLPWHQVLRTFAPQPVMPSVLVLYWIAVYCACIVYPASLSSRLMFFVCFCVSLCFTSVVDSSRSRRQNMQLKLQQL